MKFTDFMAIRIMKQDVNRSIYFKRARTNMLKQQIRTWDVLDETILSLFDSCARENYVPPAYDLLAYADINIPLAHGQSMMQPKEEARILQALAIKPEEKIAVFGADSGFLLTLLAKLGKHVYYIDYNLDSFEAVKNKLLTYPIPNITLNVGNQQHGWQDFSPFDAVILTGSLPSIPENLKQALALNGRLAVVVGDSPAMEAMLVTRIQEYTWKETKIFETIRPRMQDAKETEKFHF